MRPRLTFVILLLRLTEITDFAYEIRAKHYRSGVGNHADPLAGFAIASAGGKRAPSGWNGLASENHPDIAQSARSQRSLGYEKRTKYHYYYPRVRQEDCVTAKSRDFLHRMFDGSLRPIVAHFIENDELSDAEREELKVRAVLLE